MNVAFIASKTLEISDEFLAFAKLANFFFLFFAAFSAVFTEFADFFGLALSAVAGAFLCNDFTVYYEGIAIINLFI